MGQMASPAGVPPTRTLPPPAAAFAYRDFRLFQAARLTSIVATEVQTLAVSWEIYQHTRSPLDLGYVGLSQFLPAVLLFLATGHTADRFDRRRILLVCNAILVLCAGLLLWQASRPELSLPLVYAVLTVVGLVRAFAGPASQSLLPEIVSAAHFPNAVAWGSSIFMVATILGPGLGGAVYAIGQGAPLAFALALASYAAAFSAIAALHVRTGRMETRATTLRTLLAGFHYVWEKKLILGAISMDLFAVLLGGAVALMPVMAAEVLHVGAWGLGLLRAAPAVGAALVGAGMAHRPLRRRAGIVMLWCVAVFGAATIVFGLSRSVVLSVIALLVVGASDMVSVVIRATLVQVATPPQMRGRVSAVNLLFIGTSNELGQFESGLTAHWFGTVPAVILGGVGTLLVVALWAWRFPELRRVERLEDVQAE
jgi:MFS family permease